ncbi:MAG: hypothetical protein R6V35_05795 [Candidatus Nanohaloarchaea archaeon]
MGFLGDNEKKESDNFVEEVSISAPEEKESESRESSELKREAEKKFTGSKSSSNSEKVSLEEVHRQNEKIISMLEDLKEDDKNNSNSDVGGAMDGVL